MVEKINVKSHTRKTPSGSTKVEAHTRLVDTEVKTAMKKLKAKEDSQKEIFSGSKKIGTDPYNNRPIKVEAKITKYTRSNPKLSTDLKKVNEYKVLSLVGVSRDFGGQINNELLDKNQVKLSIPKEDAKRLKEIWDKHHLNDLNAGTKKQQKLLENFNITGSNYNYDQAVSVLRKNNLLEDRGYRYGSQWLVSDVPEKDLKFIKDFFS